MVNYWMHNGFVRVDDEKMSKSLGNFFTIRTVLEKYDAEVVRFFILRAHYRSPLNYSDVHLDDAKAALTRLYTALRGIEVASGQIDWQHPQAAKFKAAMDDDFNTPEALAVLFDLANEVNKTKSIETAGLLKALANVVGFLERDPELYLQGGVEQTLDIDALIIQRNDAKKAKNFAIADQIRKDLAEAGVVLEDTPQGTIWRRG
jgi:cysteinyl-tRNA synthetase